MSDVEGGADIERDPEIDDVLNHLEDLESTVDDTDERREVQQAISMVERLSPRDVISKYTTQDVAQTFVGGVLFSLPMLVEGGVFEIAVWLARARVGGVPVFLLGNVAFAVVMTYGLIYWSDFRQVRMKRILGVVPRRLFAVMLISLFTAVFLMMLWGRHAEGDPTSAELAARVSVIWATAAFGGSLGDILPGEGSGEDMNERLENLLGLDDEDGG